MNSALRAWAPSVVWAALIFFASAQSAVPVPLQRGTDKLAHFAVYAVFGALLGYARDRQRLHWLGPLALGLLYAASDEWHQSLVPGRTAEWGDWVADALGVAAGLGLYHHWPAARRAARRGIGVTDHEPRL